MTALTGTMSDGSIVLLYDGYTSANLFTARDYYTGDVDPARDLFSGLIYSGFATTPRPAPEHHGETGTYVPTTFFEDWYYRIHLIPAAIDVGNLVSSQTRYVYVWNAYLESKSFDTFSVTNPDGLIVNQLTGSPPPTTLAPLQLLTYTLSVEINGPPTINSSLNWTIDGETYAIPVVGRRLILFPFPPNWDDPVDETLEGRSTVTRAYDGTEQTASLRSKLRRIYEFNIALRSQDSQQLESILFGWQDRLYGLPAWPEKSHLQTASAAGDVLIQVDTQYKTYKAGGLLVVYGGPRNNEVREIASVVGNSVTLTAALDNNWPSGTPVYPVFPAAADDSFSGSRLTDGVMQMSVRFSCEPSSTDPNVPGVAAPTTYLGEELYSGKINWVDTVPITWDSDGRRLDFGTGKILMSPRSGFSTFTRRHNWLLKSHSEVFAFRGFLERRKGRAVPVYMSSGMEDFTLAKNVASSDVSIDVLPNDYENLVNANAARRDIIIHFRDGTTLTKRVGTSSLAETGNTRLTFSSSIGRNFTPAEVKRISVLSFYRLASDGVTIRWQAAGKALAEAQLVSKKAP